MRVPEPVLLRKLGFRRVEYRRTRRTAGSRLRVARSVRSPATTVGKVILLTFVSSRCKNVCPLTAELLTRTQDLLGARERDAQLVAVNANFFYNTVPDVLVWSREHRMTHRWLFLTGSESALMSVYRAYRVTPGSAHTTVVFLIDQQGRVRGVVPTALKATLDGEARALARYVRLLDPP